MKGSSYGRQLRLLRYARKHARGLSVVLLMMLVEVGLQLLRPWPLKILVDDVLLGLTSDRRRIRLLATLATSASLHEMLGLSEDDGVELKLNVAHRAMTVVDKSGWRAVTRLRPDFRVDALPISRRK